MTAGSEIENDQPITWSELPDPEISAVANLVGETLGSGFLGLPFPPLLEEIFERETGASRVRHMIVAGLIAVLTYDLFLVSDYLTMPQILPISLVIRLGIITPLAILIMAAQYRGLAPPLREASGAIVTVAGGAGLVYLLVQSGDPNAATYIYGLILVIMFGNIVLQLRYWFAVVASLLMVVIYAVVMLSEDGSSPIIQTNNIIILLSTAVLTLFANHSLEQDKRRSYLFNLRERIRQATLKERNTQLMELSHIDPLTGLANRRELAEFLDLLLQKPVTVQLAIVMFDVDHFKLYNDYYGHPLGDECLRRIAGVLMGSSRHSADLMVRFGGEEFVAVLPGCDILMAESFAERILHSVRDLAIPHATSPISGHVSISAGVSAGRIAASSEVEVILAEADAALYRAKSAGRDCVHH